MPSEEMLTTTQKRSVAGILNEVRRVKPKLRMLEALGRKDEDLEMRVKQLEQACQGALDLNELAKTEDIT